MLPAIKYLAQALFAAVINVDFPSFACHYVSLLKQGAIISDAVSVLQSSFLVLTFRI